MVKAKKTGDWVAVIEAGYSLNEDNPAWLSNLLQSVVREHWVNKPSMGYFFAFEPAGVKLRDLCVSGPPELREVIQTISQNTSSQAADILLRSDRVVSTVSERVFGRLTADEAVFRSAAGDTAADALGVVIHTGEGHGVVLTHGLAVPRVSTPAERKAWAHCAAHIGAGLRLRAMAQDLTSLDSPLIEAVFDAAGKLHDARLRATSKTARERLRSAILKIDHAKSLKGRQNSEEAISEWESLVSGRWSLIDHFDSDRRRFVVAVRNDPRFPDPRGLSLRERQVAEFAGLGQSAKEIGYLLGVSPASVVNSLRRAQLKLGLNSRVELMEFFSPGGVRANLARVALGNSDLLVSITPRLDEAKLSRLTLAEREVVTLLIAGSTNRDIAQRRATSPNTVANQIQSIFRAFGARSRGELLARLNEMDTPSAF